MFFFFSNFPFSVDAKRPYFRAPQAPRDAKRPVYRAILAPKAPNVPFRGKFLPPPAPGREASLLQGIFGTEIITGHKKCFLKWIFGAENAERPVSRKFFVLAGTAGTKTSRLKEVQ